MSKSSLCYLVIFVVSAFALGCLTPVKVEMTQKLYVDPRISEIKGVCSGYSIGIRDIEYSRAIGNYITYLKDDGILYLDEAQQWAEHPSEIVFRVVHETLKKVERFSDVDDAVKIKNPDFLCFIKLKKFFFLSHNDKKGFILSLDLKIRNALTGKIILENDFEIVKFSESGEDALYLVNQALSEFSNQLAELVNSSHFTM